MLGPHPAAIVETTKRGRGEIKPLIIELHVAGRREGVLLGSVLELRIGPGDDHIQRLVAFRPLDGDVCLKPHASEVRGRDADPRSRAVVGERDPHIWVLDHHIARYGLGDRDGVR